jgi:hypothetical protein
MAKTRAIIQAFGIDGKLKSEASRLSNYQVSASVDTWDTFVTTLIRADGSWGIKVTRKGETIFEYKGEKE